MLYVGPQGKPLFAEIPAADRKASIDLLYVTDRAPGTEAAKTLALQRRSLALDGVRLGHGRVRRRRPVGHPGCREHAEQALRVARPEAGADEGARAISRDPLWRRAHPCRPRAVARCDGRAREGGSPAAGRGRAPPRRSAAQGSRAVRPRLCQHLPGRLVHHGRAVPLPGPRVRLRDLHLAGGRLARPVLRLQRRPRVGRVRRASPEAGDSHDRRHARRAEAAPSRPQPRHRRAGDGPAPSSRSRPTSAGAFWTVDSRSRTSC